MNIKEEQETWVWHLLVVRNSCHFLYSVNIQEIIFLVKKVDLIDTFDLHPSCFIWYNGNKAEANDKYVSKWLSLRIFQYFMWDIFIVFLYFLFSINLLYSEKTRSIRPTSGQKTKLVPLEKGLFYMVLTWLNICFLFWLRIEPNKCKCCLCVCGAVCLSVWLCS